MRCEIISIGSELLTKRRSESALVVSRALVSIGMEVNRVTTVPDNTEELSSVFREVAGRSDIIISVGGLGATPDDITKEVVSEAFNIKLEFSRKAMENVAKYFSNLGRNIPSCCDKQADVLYGARLLENKKGSCPGQIVDLGNSKLLILLPGPVEEVEYLMTNKIIDIFKEKYERKIKKTSTVNIVGLCEAEVANRLKENLATEKYVKENKIDFFYENYSGGVNLTIDVIGDNEMLVDEVLHKLNNEISKVLEDNIVDPDGKKIENVIGELLTRKRKTLAIAESCTGGMLSSMITDVPGSSIYFKQGVVTYSSGSKIKQLNVNPDVIKKQSAVSKDVAKEMAENLRKISGADYAISVTGYAGPQAAKDKKAGSGYIALASAENVDVAKVEFSGHRKKVKEKFSCTALEMLWRKLKEK